MKKYIYAIPALMMACMLPACTAEEGAEPGTDATPAVTVYTYEPSDENLNPDNDVTVRFATNSATKEVAYLVEKGDDVEAFLKGINPNGDKENEAEQAYVDRVLQNGQKITVNGAESVDVNLTGLYGPYVISAVAVGSRDRKSMTFTGLDWENVTSGTFHYRQTFLPVSTRVCNLQVCTTNDKLFRIENAFGEGYSMKFELLDATANDEDGTYTLFRIPLQKTPWKINLTSGGPYPIVVEDIGYWQGDASFVTGATGYENGMYADHTAFFRIAWGADRGSNIGVFSFETPSFFIPD